MQRRGAVERADSVDKASRRRAEEDGLERRRLEALVAKKDSELADAREDLRRLALERRQTHERAEQLAVKQTELERSVSVPLARPA